MKKTLHYLILIVVLQCTAFAQAQWQNGLWVGKEAYNWYFCMDAGLNFEQSPPLPLADGNVSTIIGYETDQNGIINPDTEYITYGGSSVMSDADGNLLFYTDGNKVWNRNHQVMANGTDLISGPYGKQNNIIVPFPGNPNKYFIFSVKEPSYWTLPYPFPIGNPLYSWRVVYSEVDMSLDNGLGGVTGNKNVVLAGVDEQVFLAGSYYPRITATYHSDGHNIWVMMHGIANNEFRAFLVSDAGVSTTPVISAIGVSYDGMPDTMAQMKFSPDGSKIVKSLMLYDDQKNVEVFNFDKSTGQVTDILVTLGEQEFMNDGELAGIQGLEFSPNSKLLYTTGVISGALKQFNLEAGDEAAIKASGITISNFEDMQFNHFMQVAPDGKIYVAYSEVAFGGWGVPMELSTINVINFPNNVGTSCGFQPNAIDLGSGKSGHSFPSFIQDYFESGILYDGDTCFKEAVTFSTLRIPGIESIIWNFGDLASGADNTSTALVPTHIFSNPGTYTVTAVITSNGAQQTTSNQIVILPLPAAAVPSGADLALCADSSGNATFNLRGLDTTILSGQNPTDYTVVYYASDEDMEADNPIGMPDAFTTNGQAIFAEVTNVSTGCSSSLQFNLVVNSLPVAHIPTTQEQCSNTSGVAVFDLTEQTPVILGGQDPDKFNVVYYTDAAGTQEIAQPEAFESAGQTVYAYVYNVVTGCTVATQFEVIMLALPALPDVTSFTGCSPFNLLEIIGIPADDSSYAYFTTEGDALANSNPIPNPGVYGIEGNNGTVYIRVQNPDGCVQVAELSIVPGNCFIPRGISPNNDTLNDNFDLSGFGVSTIEIFNRYGQQVYSKSNYTAEWHGQSSNGNELPTGTYFYALRLNDGQHKTGWVYVNREQ